MNALTQNFFSRIPVRVAIALLLCQACRLSGQTVLVEAEGFNNSGGWKIDTQSVEQMGSVYAIAHGMGKPVANATTTVAFPAPGTYHVWVRTRNWVPGNWAAPGQFKVSVAGSDLAPVFGTELANWHWQDGGRVTINGLAAEVALKDLTGFDGRCDAIAFVADNDSPPPGDLPGLKAWRRLVKNEALTPSDVRQFDVVIVGGGMAGCCAALAAARSGLMVALVQDRDILGGNASQEVRVGTRGAIRNAIVDEIDTLSLDNQSSGTISADANRKAVIQREANITLLMPWRAEDAGTDPATKRITHVDARHTRTGERARLQAPLFIDCTGDGWIGYWAGADYRMGWEAKSEFNESLGKDVASAMTMGNSVQWTSKIGSSASVFPAVPWAMDVAGKASATNGDWTWEYGMQKNTITDAEEIRDHLLRAVFGNFSNAKKLPTNAMRELDWVAYIAGKRESRRLMGDHILTQNDLEGGVYFEDAVGTTDWGIDLHYETAVSYISTYQKTNIASICYFPYRSLYSRNIPNLLMAGRNFSCTHAGLGSPRVMNTTGQMGVAVGYAAAICKQYGIEPRDVYRIPDRMLELQARITGTWPARPSPVILNGTIVDNADPTGVTIIGDWSPSTGVAGYNGSNFLYGAASSTPGIRSVTFRPVLPAAGSYEVFIKYTQHPNRSTATPVTIRSKAGAAPLTIPVNQQINGGTWFSLGTYVCDAATASVTVSNAPTGNAIADAVAFVPPGQTSVPTDDLDGDGLPDWWERWYFLSETKADPSADSDHDGRNNFVEYFTGCDPGDANSRFDARVAIDAQSGGINLRWPSTEERTYRVEVSTDCVSWSPFQEAITATPPENTLNVVPTGPKQFFRIAVEQ